MSCGQVLQLRSGRWGWMALQQGQEQYLPDLGQQIGPASAPGLGGFVLEAA